MTGKIVTSTEFRNHVGVYMDLAATEPVVITKYGRKVAVLLDIDEFERLKSSMAQRAKYVSEIADEDWSRIMESDDLPNTTQRERRDEDV